MKNWYNEYPNLLESEIRSLKENGILVDEANLKPKSFDKEGVKLTCIIPKENTLGLDLTSDLSLSIHFPSNYPYFRPEVHVNSEAILPRHQDPIGKSLCLIPRPTQFWNPEDGLYNYLKERLPIVFVKGNVIDQDAISKDPDEQAEPVSEYYINKTNVAILSSRPKFDDKKFIGSDDFEILDSGNIQITFSSNSAKVRLVKTINLGEELTTFPIPQIDSEILKIILEKWFDSQGKVIAEFPFTNILKDEKSYKTKWYKINSLEKLLNRKDSFNWLMSELKNKGIQQPLSLRIQTNNYTVERAVVLLFPEEEIAGTIGWGWAFFIGGYVMIPNGKSRASAPFPLVLPIMSIDKSELLTRIPYSKVLNDKTVSIIGLGSLGAPSALEFAKNGVKEIRLMDFDIVEATSIVRWPLGIESAGMLKTVALKEFIEKNYPFVSVKIFHHKIGSADIIAFPNENEKLEEFLNGTDLLYDASAEEGVNNLLSTLCRINRIPYLEIEGRRGAWGGYVMRVLPEKTKGCWMCLQYCLSDGNVTPPKEDNNGMIQPKGCGDLTFTGASYDMQNISLAGVRMAVSSLSQEDNSGNWDVAILSMVDDNSQPIIPKWKSYRLKIHPNCPICNAGSLD